MLDLAPPLSRNFHSRLSGKTGLRLISLAGDLYLAQHLILVDRMRWEDRGTMSTPDPIGQLRSYFQLTDAILILRILSPLLNEHGKASLPFLESELASGKSP